MPKINKIDINFKAVELIITEAMPVCDIGEKGSLTQFHSEILHYEQSIAKLLQKQVDMKDKAAAHDFNEVLYQQYEELNQFLEKKIQQVADRLKEKNSQSFKLALEKIQVVLTEYRKLITEHQINKKSFIENRELHKTEYEFCNLLGGKYYQMRQGDDPFIGGQLVGGVAIKSNGFCAGEVIEWALMFLDSNEPRYPIMGGHNVHQYQSDQSELKNTIAKKISEASFKQLDFYDLLEQCKPNKVYYLSMKSVESGHAVGIKRFKDGSYHFFEPNYGVIFLRDRNAMASWLSFYAARTRRLQGARDKYILYEFIRDVKNPDLDPTPTPSDYAELETEQDIDVRNQRLNYMLLNEIAVLVHGIDPLKSGPIKTKRNFEALVSLLRHQVLYNHCPTFRENVRYILMFLESGDTETVNQHLEFNTSHNPYGVDVASLKVVLKEIVRKNIRQLFPEIIDIAATSHRDLRAAILSTKKLDFDVSRDIKRFLGTIKAAEINLRTEIASAVKDNPKRSEVLVYLYEKLILSKVDNALKILLASSLDADAARQKFLVIKNQADTILPGMTSETDPITVFNVNELLDDLINKMMAEGYFETAKMLDKFAEQIDAYVDEWQRKTMNIDNAMSYVTYATGNAFTGDLLKLRESVMKMSHQIRQFQVAMPNTNEVIFTDFPLSLKNIRNFLIKGNNDFTVFFSMWKPDQEMQPSESETALLNNIYEYLIKNNGQLMYAQIKMIIDTLQADNQDNVDALKYLSQLLRTHVDRLRQYFYDMLQPETRELQQQTLGEMIQVLLGTLRKVSFNRIDDSGQLQVSEAGTVQVDVKETAELILLLHQVVVQLKEYWRAILLEQGKIYGVQGVIDDDIHNLPLDKLLKRHYVVRIKGVTDLLRSTEEQLTGLLNNTRSAEDVRHFLSQQFVKTNDQVDMRATMKRKFPDDADHDKQVSQVLMETMHILRKKIAEFSDGIKARKVSNQQVLQAKMTTHEKAYAYDLHLLTLFKQSLDSLEHVLGSEIAVLLRLPSCHLYSREQFPEFHAAHMRQNSELVDDFLENHVDMSMMRMTKLKHIYVLIKEILTDIKLDAELADDLNIPFYNKIQEMLDKIEIQIEQLRPFDSNNNNDEDELHQTMRFYTEDDLLMHCRALERIVGIPLFSGQLSLLPDLKDQIVAAAHLESQQQKPTRFAAFISLFTPDRTSQHSASSSSSSDSSSPPKSPSPRK